MATDAHGKLLYTAGADALIKSWNISTGQCLKVRNTLKKLHLRTDMTSPPGGVARRPFEIFCSPNYGEKKISLGRRATIIFRIVELQRPFQNDFGHCLEQR